jgi:hypothetical protein
MHLKSREYRTILEDFWVKKEDRGRWTEDPGVLPRYRDTRELVDPVLSKRLAVRQDCRTDGIAPCGWMPDHVRHDKRERISKIEIQMLHNRVNQR